MVDFSNGVNAPGPASYTAPLMDFGVLGNLANTYYQGRENQFAEQQRQRELTLQKPIDSSDPNAVALELMRRGGAGYAQQLIPFLERQQPGEVSPLTGGQPGTSQPNTTGAPAPGGASPAGTTTSPQPAPSPAPNPPPAPMRPQGSPAGDDGVSSVVAVASSRLPEDSQKTGAVINNIAKALGVDPNQPLSLEQKARAAQLIESYAKRNGIAPPAAAAPAEAPAATGGATQAQPQPGAPDAASGGPILPQGFTDPRKAVIALRAGAARALASGNLNTKAQAPQMTEWADRIEQAVAGPQELAVVSQDQFGNPIHGFVNKYTQTVKPVGGSPTAAGNGPGGNTERIGDDYLKQFSPEIQNAVKNYVGGITLPTGNPRKGFTEQVKVIAQKYGNDIGLPADDANFAARRTMRNNLSLTTAGSLGGQINFAGTSLEHLSNAAAHAEALDNFGGWGLAPFASIVNRFRGLGTAQAAKIDALNTDVQHFGQEITKFYAGSPGGEAERNRFLESISAAKSPQQLAAVIKAERELIPGRLSQLDAQIKSVLGPMADKYPVIRPATQKSIDKIDAIVARMEGKTAPAASEASSAAPAAPQTIKSKSEYDALPKGAQFIGPDGKPWQKP